MDRQTNQTSAEQWLELTLRNETDHTLFIQGARPNGYMVESFILRKNNTVWQRQSVGVDRDLEMLPVGPNQEIKVLRRESLKNIGSQVMLTFLTSDSKQGSGSRVLLGPIQIPAPGTGQSATKKTNAVNFNPQPNFEGFDEFVAKVLKEWPLPGVSVAVIHEGKTFLAKGYGFRDIEKQLPVTEKTLFPIASITKPFTALSAAILVDDGKLHWNDRVREHLRTFRLHDEKAAAELTVLDCLTHQTGLPLAGLRWYGVKGWPEKHMNPQIAYRTLRYLEPSAPARTRYQYSNSGYLVVGQMVEKYGGTWDAFVQERILDPLEMNRTNFSVRTSQADADHAKPYDLLDGEIVRRPFFPGEVLAPAGGINSSAEEMVQLLRLFLQQGTLDGQRIASKGRMKEMLTPEVVMPELNSYASTTGFHGMGWQVLIIQGEKWGRHTGSLPGFTSVVGFCPKRKCGYVVLTNLAFRSHAELIESQIRGRLLGKIPADRLEEFRKIDATNREAALQLVAEHRATQIKNTKPAHPLCDYVGTYTNPAYGQFIVTLKDGALSWHHHGFRGPLTHYHYEVFDMEGDYNFNGIATDDISRVLVNFHTNKDGAVESVRLSRYTTSNVLFSRKATDEGKRDPDANVR